MHPFPRPTVAHRVIFGAQADTIAKVLPLNPRLCCDWCGDTGVTLRNVPSGLTTKPCCRECFAEHVAEAREYDFHDWPLLNPTFPANNSHRPQIVPDAPMIEWADPDDFTAPNEWGSGQSVAALCVVAAGMAAAAVVLMVLSWATGWPL